MKPFATCLLIVVFIFTDLLQGFPTLIGTAYADSQSDLPLANMNLQQFLQQGSQDKAYHGPFVFPQVMFNPLI